MAKAKTTGVKKTSPSKGTSLADIPTAPLAVPIRDFPRELLMGLGLRQDMLTLSDGNDRLGGVTTGSGLGNDFIILEWKGRYAVLRGSEIFKTWVATFAAEDAERMP